MENITNEATTIEKLQEENSILNQRNSILQQEKAELSAKLNWFEEQFRLNQHKQFGTSSEKTATEQLSLFNEAEIEVKPGAPEPTVEEITYKRRKKKGHREEMFKDLPVETIEYCLSEDEQVCDCCGGKLHEMSTEVRRELKIVLLLIFLQCHVESLSFQPEHALHTGQNEYF